MSALLQDVLRSKTTVDSKLIERKLNSLSFSTMQGSNPNALSQNNASDDSDDELVNVVSVPGTPSRTRPPSPTRGGTASRHPRRPLHISSSPVLKTDFLKALPTEISQKIFSKLPVKDLARCALVSKKWHRSQTINYVWFQYYRKENFHDESLPPGKWTKRESKQNWRIAYLKSTSDRSPTNGTFSSRGGSGYSTPSSNLGSGFGSGYQTPREIKEEKWKLENEAVVSPGKVEMRALYKEMGGRKARGKAKMGSAGTRTARDKGGWVENDGW
ncbi:hypothetical protein J3R30DRAFT_3283581 [Lentinula aciculospora]|uniref:F-box domain-containing protein n=1 Tax=Lentinula aciculospora TaxID=153920 RepID=A0A9W9AN22_9AGAR|nr:hypothetical protein J3R30DRAFT_3283581 [Lentinula aciculospora]